MHLTEIDDGVGVSVGVDNDFDIVIGVEVKIEMEVVVGADVDMEVLRVDVVLVIAKVANEVDILDIIELAAEVGTTADTLDGFGVFTNDAVVELDDTTGTEVELDLLEVDMIDGVLVEVVDGATDEACVEDEIGDAVALPATTDVTEVVDPLLPALDT